MLWGRPGILCSSRLGLRHTSGCAVCTGTTGPGPLHPGAEEPPAPAGRSRGGLLAGTSGVGCDHRRGGGRNAAATRQPSPSPCVPNLQPLPAPGLTSLAELTAAGGPAALPAAPAWPCCGGRCGHGSPWPVSSHAWPPPHPGSSALPPSEHPGWGRQASPHAQGGLGSWPSALRRKRGPLGPTCGVSLLTSQRSGGPPSASSPDDRAGSRVPAREAPVCIRAKWQPGSAG